MNTNVFNLPWSADSYLLIPSAVYRSNRFPTAERHTLAEQQKRHPGELLVASTVATVQGQEDLLEIPANRCSTPLLAAWSRPAGAVFWLELPADAPLAGFRIQENLPKGELHIEIHHPLRRGQRLSPGRSPVLHPDADLPSLKDIHVDLEKTPCGDQLTFFRLLRGRLMDSLSRQPVPEPPFYPETAWRICETKLNRDNWNETAGYFHAYLAHGKRFDPEIGWTGGLQMLEPLWKLGSEMTRQRVSRDLHGFLACGQSACGLIYARRTEQGGGPDGFNGEHHLRRTGDALHTLLSLLPDFPEAETFCYRTARALSDLFSTSDRLPHHVDQESGEVRVTGGTGAASAVGALARAAAHWGDPAFKAAALTAGGHLWEQNLAQGLFGGGPNDACQTPDSESLYACIGAFLDLQSLDPAGDWLDRASTAADLFSTWVSTRPLPLPSDSTLARMNMPTVGTVWANLRNPHGAPGICTASTRDLRRLAAATGETDWTRLADHIDAVLPWYLSTEDRPIPAHPGAQPLPPGWMNEAIFCNDHNAPYDNPYANPPGELWFGSCWCEVSFWLTLQDQQIPSNLAPI